jgi:hypothetical protein
MAPAAEFQDPAGVNPLILCDMKLVQAQIGIGDVEQMAACHILLRGTMHESAAGKVFEDLECHALEPPIQYRVSA